MHFCSTSSLEKCFSACIIIEQQKPNLTVGKINVTGQYNGNNLCSSLHKYYLQGHIINRKNIISIQFYAKHQINNTKQLNCVYNLYLKIFATPNYHITNLSDVVSLLSNLHCTVLNLKYRVLVKQAYTKEI